MMERTCAQVHNLIANAMQHLTGRLLQAHGREEKGGGPGAAVRGAVPEKDRDARLRDGPETTRAEQRAGGSRALSPPGC